MRLPDKVNILGLDHTIEYCTKASDVDSQKRRGYKGEIDYWNRSIRILRDGVTLGEQFATLVHEITHGIVAILNLPSFDVEKIKNAEDDIDRFSVALADVLTRNGWLKLEE